MNTGLVGFQERHDTEFFGYLPRPNLQFLQKIPVLWEKTSVDPGIWKTKQASGRLLPGESGNSNYAALL
jgi:hypothetical protein